MGAQQTVQWLRVAIERLDCAVNSTAHDIEDFGGYGDLLSLRVSLEDAEGYATREMTDNWDGQEGLSGAEQALTDATVDLAAADDGQSPAIQECQTKVALAQERCREARAAYEALHQARQELTAKIAALRSDADRLIEQLRAAANLAVEASDNAYAAQEQAEEIADRVEASVS